MLMSSKKWLPVLLVLELARDCQGRKPTISPAKPEIYIDEGDSLELTCTSAKTMKFYYPKKSTDPIETSSTTLKEQSLNAEQKIIFRRSQMLRGDTGWYGCADNDTDVTPKIYDQPEVSWTYVYVRSNKSYFVQSDERQSFRVVAGGNATLPCRPTSPHYKVILNRDGEETQMSGRASYDPRFGFKLRNVTKADSDYFQCLIQEGETIQEITFQLIVTEIPMLNKPKIIEDTLRYVTRGQKLSVNCTTVVDADTPYVLNWTTPQSSGRITTHLYTERIAGNKRKTTSELTINRVKDEDRGDYECKIEALSTKKETKTFIDVHDPNKKYINLTSPDKDRHYLKMDRDFIQWVVNVHAHPQPKLKWLNPRGSEIGTWIGPEGPKYAVNRTFSSTTLRINHLELDDMGLYTLQATNEDQTETLNFTLEVTAKPKPSFDKLKDFYWPKRKVRITCKIEAFPAPNVSWTFLEAPNYPSLKGSVMVQLKNYSMSNKTPKVHSVVTITIEMSGHLICRACNTLGCDSATGVILVSDVHDGFGIIKMNNQLTERDNVEMTCAASVYNYTRVEWLKNTNEVIVNTDRISITKSSTNFTHRSTLQIKDIRKSDKNTNYVCNATTVDDVIVSSEYKLPFHDPVPAVIWKTNMNKTKILRDRSTAGHEPEILKCYVQGMPPPNVTWYKDDTIIKADTPYEYCHNNQELHIKYLLEENSGTYKCKVENRFGTDENYQIIEIKAKEVSKVLIISIVVLVLICIILVIYFAIKMHQEKVMRKQLMEAGLTHFEEGALECLNPDLTVDDQAELLPYNKKWEFPRERLKFGKQLGLGAFGVVMKAEAQGICEGEAVSTVAVKMVRRSTEATYIRALASELKIMVHLGKHLNVVNLLGACTKNITKRELLVIVEYCRFGNLHNYLLRHRADFINQIDPATCKLDPSIGLDVLTRTMSVGSNNSLSANSSNSNAGAELVSYSAGTDSQGISMSPDGCVLSNNSTQPGWRSNYRGDYKDQNLKPICTQDLLSWAFQVARGMEYLSQRKVLHGDLAARNILLAENNIVKICDFGLAKTMYKDDNYKKKGDAPLPIKWMAIESIRDRVFSTQSDIWSFGIVLWEFFTLAKTPYPGVEAEKQYQKLIEGYRLEQPEYATDEVYDIMLQCWKAKPTLRPTFTNLVSSIGDLLEESVKEHYVDLNTPYMDMNTMVLESGKNDYLTMMSAPDHEALVSPNPDYVNSPSFAPATPQDDSYIPMSPSIRGEDSGIFSPRIAPNTNKFDFPNSDGKSNVHSDSESEAVELSPMLNHEDDHYLQAINVQERRAKFTRQKQAMINSGRAENSIVEDTGYCNVPQNLRLIDLNKADTGESVIDGMKRTEVKNSTKEPRDYLPSITRTQDNYVNMATEKKDLRNDIPASFSNPSYIIMVNREVEQTGG